jgi:hypothetical protein
MKHLALRQYLDHSREIIKMWKNERCKYGRQLDIWDIPDPETKYEHPGSFIFTKDDLEYNGMKIKLQVNITG